MGRVFRILLIVIVVLVAVVAAAIFLVPVEVYRDQIRQAALEATGRNLELKGEMSLTVWPEIGIEVNDVAFENAPGAHEGQMATMESLILGVELMPLFSGELKVRSLVLTKPVINLEVDKSGKGNWVFPEKPATDESAPSEGGGFSLSNISFGDVRLIDGIVTYRNAKSGESRRIDDIDASIELTDLDNPLKIVGAVTFNGERLDLDVGVAKPRAAMDGGTTKLTVRLDSDVLDATLDGAVDMDTSAISGAVMLKTESLRRLAAFAGSELPPGGGLGPLSLSGDFAMAGSQVTFKRAKLSLDDMTGEGDIVVSTAGAVPTIKGDFNLDRLDLNTYMGADADTGQPAAGPAGADGWSDAPIDLKPLKSVNADFTFSVGQLLFQRMTIQRSTLTLSLKGGVMTATLKELNLYDGRASGVLVADGSKPTPSIRTKLDVTGVQALAFLTAAVGLERLEGIGALSVDLKSSGPSQRALMNGLNGNGSVKFADGAIRGINLAAIARSVLKALSGDAVSENAKTDFAELSGTFTVTNGVLDNLDLKLLNPLIRISGQGRVGIGGRNIDYRIEPKLVGTLEGQGGSADIAGIPVPFFIKGTWDHVTFAPDWKAIQELLLSGGLNLDQFKNLGLSPTILGQLQIAAGGGQLPAIPGVPGLTGTGGLPLPISGLGDLPIPGGDQGGSNPLGDLIPGLGDQGGNDDDDEDDNGGSPIPIPSIPGVTLPGSGGSQSDDDDEPATSGSSGGSDADEAPSASSGSPGGTDAAPAPIPPPADATVPAAPPEASTSDPETAQPCVATSETPPPERRRRRDPPPAEGCVQDGATLPDAQPPAGTDPPPDQ